MAIDSVPGHFYDDIPIILAGKKNQQVNLQIDRKGTSVTLMATSKCRRKNRPSNIVV